jgi:ankyrin repeat protein
MACTHVDSCELFAQFALNPALKVWQFHYCDQDFKRCARYQLSLTGAAVPLNLLPNGSRVEAARSDADYGATAIFNAILKRRMPMIESLLRTGMDINIRDSRGMTPLMAAAATGDVEIVKFLLKKKAAPQLKSTAGETAYEIATRAGFGNVAALLASAAHASNSAEKSARRPGILARLLAPVAARVAK